MPPGPLSNPSPQSGKYQKLPKTPTNEHGQATKLHFFSCEAAQRTFHITWLTFWLCFFVWFCTTNICHEISSDLNLTMTQHQVAGTLSITSTIFFRLLIADLCRKYGSRVTYIIVMIGVIVSLIGMALIQSVVGYMIFHVALGIAGASFVVTQYHITRMFSDKVVPMAQAISAGFGNFGGGCANFLVPVLIYYTGLSWRWFMIIFAVVVFVFCFLYYFGTTDHPIVPENPSVSKLEPQFPIDLVERQNAKQQDTPTRGPPDKQIGHSFRDAITDYRTWILFLCYAASFGVEITFYLFAAHYFQRAHGLGTIMSGLIVMIWSSMNLFARPLGGWFSNQYDMTGRVGWLFVLLFLESLFLMLFGVVGHLSLYGAIGVSLLLSVCVQMAEGVVFNITPFVQPKSVGHVMGIVGSDGTLGATFFSFAIFIPWGKTQFDERYTWIIVGCIVMIIAFGSLRIKFTEREMMEMRQKERECYDLDRLETEGRDVAARSLHLFEAKPADLSSSDAK
eukprot:114863_1